MESLNEEVDFMFETLGELLKEEDEGEKSLI